MAYNLNSFVLFSGKKGGTTSVPQLEISIFIFKHKSSAILITINIINIITPDYREIQIHYLLKAFIIPSDILIFFH